MQTHRLLWARRVFDASNTRSHGDSLGREPRCVHFEREARGRCGAMIVLGLRFHFLDVEDLSFFVKESDRQRNQRVAHPHAMPVPERENKQHALVRTEAATLHQALHAGRLVCSDFRLDAMETGAQFHDRHRLGHDRRRGQEQEADE